MRRASWDRESSRAPDRNCRFDVPSDGRLESVRRNSLTVHSRADAYVVPGATLAACLLRVHFRDVELAFHFLERIPKLACVPIYGLLFILGLGIQNFGEMIKLLKDNVRKDRNGP
jgi:hypothetical protein